MASTWETIETQRTATYWGKTMTDTRREAFEGIDASTLRSMTLDAILERGPTGLTADEAANVVNVDRLAIRPRVSELNKRGLIVDSGQRRENASGKRAIVWVGAGYKPPEPAETEAAAPEPAAASTTGPIRQRDLF